MIDDVEVHLWWSDYDALPYTPGVFFHGDGYGDGVEGCRGDGESERIYTEYYLDETK